MTSGVYLVLHVFLIFMFDHPPNHDPTTPATWSYLRPPRLDVADRAQLGPRLRRLGVPGGPHRATLPMRARSLRPRERPVR